MDIEEPNEFQSGGGYCLNQAFLIRTRGRTGEFPVGEISRPQTADSYGD